MKFPSWKTVDGSEIRRSPVEVGSFSHYSQGFSTGRRLGDENREKAGPQVVRIFCFFLEGVIQMGLAFWGRNQKIIQMCMLILKKFPFFLCIFWGWE